MCDVVSVSIEGTQLQAELEDLLVNKMELHGALLCQPKYVRGEPDRMNIFILSPDEADQVAALIKEIKEARKK